MSHPAMTAPEAPAALRHCITFGTSKGLAFVSVLELGTLWERTLRRARIPLKYSQGYNPRPRMHFAAPLPVGCGSKADLLDVTLEQPRTPREFAGAVSGLTPRYLRLVGVTAVDDKAPSLSEQLVAAEYSVWVRDVEQPTLIASIGRLLEAESLLVPRLGGRHRGKTYDLRALISVLELDPSAPQPWLGIHMQLNARPGATGRPDEVLKALEVAEVSRRCVRTRLILDAGYGEEGT